MMPFSEAVYHDAQPIPYAPSEGRRALVRELSIGFDGGRSGRRHVVDAEAVERPSDHWPIAHVDF